MRPWLTCSLLAALVAGCAMEEPGITPTQNDFYFPTSLTLDPDRLKKDAQGNFTQYILYVSNSNADILYNAATIMALDLKSLPTRLSGLQDKVQAGELKCDPGRVNSTFYECDEEQFVLTNATIRLGNYPAGIRVSSLQNLPDPTRLPANQRLFVPVRGDNSLVWIDSVDLDAGGLDLRCDSTNCQGAGKSDCETWACDAAHRVTYSNDVRKNLPDDPYGVYLNQLKAVHLDSRGKRRTCIDKVSSVACDCTDSTGAKIRECSSSVTTDCCVPAPGYDQLFLLHLEGGEVSYFTVEPDGVVMRDTRGGFFTTSSSVVGGYTVLPALPGDAESPMVISSQADNVLASFVISKDNRILDQSRLPVSIINPGDDVRGLAFTPGGDRLFLVNREPASLVAYDMTRTGSTREKPIWLVEVGPEPSLVYLAQNPFRPDDPDALLAYVVCFAGQQIYVVDIQLRKLVDQIPTGRGPHEMVIDSANKRAFVANFLDNTVGVIELETSQPMFHRMVMQIGLVKDLILN